MLHQLGIQHDAFSFKFQGLDARLSGVEGAKVIKEGLCRNPNEAKAESLPLVILLHGVYGSHWAWLFKGGAHRCWTGSSRRRICRR
jgi:hypothetical protein